ncbi:hypothetical protein [Shewanella zhangzhouensis]|uniref:hypothetical protein n=1 Tax=Shewanella zhangzhouensis TaxID=2864213 RepID=UPI001C65E39E|nr:hypothetical protein [Shewanella zhangzhouensis]QYK06007.1 hypothetical protein K0H63_03965 [Shewanella zhangzhouensis]
MMKFKYARNVLALAVVGALAGGCGGSDSDTEPPTTPEYAQKVVGSVSFNGAVAGVSVCADLNFNASCDGDEPDAISDAEGAFTLEWQSLEAMPDYQLVAELPQSASVAVIAPLAMTPKSAALAGAPARAPGSAAVSPPPVTERLLARKEHGGIINPLTDIEVRRLEGADTADAIAISARLKLLLPTIFGVDAQNPYAVSAAETGTQAFTDALALLNHIEALIDGQLSEVLAAEEVLFVSQTLLQSLAGEAGMSLTDWLATDPLNLRYRVSDVLKNLGYITSPIDERLMWDQDWALLARNEAEDDGESHLFNLMTVGDKVFAELRAGSIESSLLVTVSDGVVSRTELGGEALASECWNTELSQWIGPNGADGYEVPEPITLDNRLTRVYEGTYVPVVMTVDKFSAGDSEFQTLIAALPAPLKLSSISWPDTIYRLQYQQTGDVLCRSEGALSHGFDTPAAEIDSVAIIEALWRYEFDDGAYQLIDENRFIIKSEVVAGQDMTYEWSLQTAQNGAPMLHIEVVEGLPPELVGLDDGEYWLLEQGSLYEVDLNRSFDSKALNWLWLSYDASFSPTLRAHLNGL